ncbi:hypothetical protein [Desulfovibrio sp. ZJ369]|nr:hypothetical protein [Desulfovibrio sp. ZJ369]
MDKKMDNQPGDLQGMKRQSQAPGFSYIYMKLKKMYREGTPGIYM